MRALMSVAARYTTAKGNARLSDFFQRACFCFRDWALGQRARFDLTI
jgi:hypothetical protein